MMPSLGSSDGERDSAKKSRRVFDFPMQTLLEYSFLRQDEAARALGVAPITLKRICQRLKYRWPYRMLKAQARREGRSASKPKQLQKDPTGSVASTILSISSPFSSPEPEPRAHADALPSSLYVQLPRLNALPCCRHLEPSYALQQQPRALPRLPSISILTASLARAQQAPIRLPKLLPSQQLQPHQQLLVDPTQRKLRPESKFPLEAQRRADAATVQPPSSRTAAMSASRLAQRGSSPHDHHFVEEREKKRTRLTL